MKLGIGNEREVSTDSKVSSCKRTYEENQGTENPREGLYEKDEIGLPTLRHVNNIFTDNSKGGFEPLT